MSGPKDFTNTSYLNSPYSDPDTTPTSPSTFLPRRKKSSKSPATLTSQLSKLSSKAYKASSGLLNEVSNSDIVKTANTILKDTITTSSNFLTDDTDSSNRIIDLDNPSTFTLDKLRRPFNPKTKKFYSSKSHEPKEKIGKWLSYQIDRSKYQYYSASYFNQNTPYAIPESLKNAKCICGLEPMIDVRDNKDSKKGEDKYLYARMEHDPKELDSFLPIEYLRLTVEDKDSENDDDYHMITDEDRFEEDGFEIVKAEGSSYQKQVLDDDDEEEGKLQEFVKDLKNALEWKLPSSDEAKTYKVRRDSKKSIETSAVSSEKSNRGC